MRPINISQPSQILDARQQSLVRLFETFPKRKFVLVGDTSSSTLLSAYPQIAMQFPNQLACIFIRNTSATDSDDVLPYNTKEFQNISSNQYFFYRDPQGKPSHP
jgi:phosphatidate phosphatase APP1